MKELGDTTLIVLLLTFVILVVFVVGVLWIGLPPLATWITVCFGAIIGVLAGMTKNKGDTK